jgi:N-acetylmuramoyl-L-alanine amidase
VNGLEIVSRHLPYVRRLEQRDPAEVDLVVVHCTELPDLEAARRCGETIVYPDSRTGNSGHFYIERDGHVEEWVPTSRIAHHVRGFNERSIGVELDNLGRYPDWYHSGRQRMIQPYSDAQLDSLVALITGLRDALPGLCWIAGHEDLDRSRVPASDQPDRLVRRKMDPGTCFPWRDILPAVGLDRLGA